MRILGIDYGAARIGVALGDTDSGIATPWAVLENLGHGEVVKQIKLMCEREQAERVVVGVPRPMRDTGMENEQVKEVRLFITDLRSSGIPVDEEDETLTSRLAARHVHAAGGKGKRDDLAAAAILETWLGRHVLPS